MREPLLLEGKLDPRQLWCLLEFVYLFTLCEHLCAQLYIYFIYKRSVDQQCW